MGCSFHWKATEEDIFRQRRCGCFIESLFDADENGQSSNFHSGMKCDTYNDFYSGYFLELFGGNRTVEYKTLNLVGATIYSDFDFLKGNAENQQSFVFNNTESFPPELITIEKISDLSMLENLEAQEEFSAIKDDHPDQFKALYLRGVRDRLLAGEYWLALLLYSIKKQFLPDLSASDDYCNFEDISKTNPDIPAEFSETICKSSLRNKWGAQYTK